MQADGHDFVSKRLRHKASTSRIHSRPSPHSAVNAAAQVSLACINDLKTHSFRFPRPSRA
jgi:hypothetical protein